MRRGIALSSACLMLLVGLIPARAEDRPAAAARCELTAFPPLPAMTPEPSGWRGMLYGAMHAFARADAPDAALKQLGGSSLTMRADLEVFRAALLDDLRNDIRCLTREARIAHGDLAVRDGSVELHLRETTSAPRAIAALAAANGGAVDAIDFVDAGDGLIRLTPTDEGFAGRFGAMLDRATEVVAGRVKDLGIAKASVARDGADRIVIRLPGVKDASRFVAMFSKPARLELRLVDASMSAEDALKSGVPFDDDVLYGLKDKRPWLVAKKVSVGGEHLVEAYAGLPESGEPYVYFRLDDGGTRAFADTTRENVGRPFAIVLDDAVISAPVIREPIVGGTGQINGGFTIAEARYLGLLLNSGALPLRLELVDQQT